MGQDGTGVDVACCLLGYSWTLVGRLATECSLVLNSWMAGKWNLAGRPMTKPVAVRKLLVKRKQRMHLIVLMICMRLTISWVGIITRPGMSTNMTDMARVAIRGEGRRMHVRSVGTGVGGGLGR